MAKNKNELTNVSAPMLPMLQMLGNIMPSQIPPMKYSSGIFGNFIHNWKLEQMEKAAKMESEISRFKRLQVVDTINNMTDAVTLSERLSLALKEYRTRSEALDLEILVAKKKLEMLDGELGYGRLKGDELVVDIQIKQAKLSEQLIKNRLMEMEEQHAKLEYDIKKKEMKEVLNDTETEDRDS